MLTTNQFVGLRPAGAQDGGAKMPYPTLSSALHLFWQRYTVLPPPPTLLTPPTLTTITFHATGRVPRRPLSLHPDAIFLLNGIFLLGSQRAAEHVNGRNNYIDTLGP